jgi:hypothetical protein
MKGIALPIHIVILIVLGLLCLVGLVGFLLHISRPEPAELEALYQAACLKLFVDCEQDWQSVEITSKGNTYTLKDICNKLGISDQTSCKKGCGC